ncbi:carboxymuconolactone decarboxylase family protein [Streptosporangium pseudovulgare]|uniref:4-carboxymuconolactone decarboxylase n=1 Tax=Streptosporangium pseudovulgare TaxID=35765 RepID=A0ABQ2RBF3_9ACTN|nr:carboxymuconolactone decarboxylase family protein [Streptosporangium pseudovulgare]GGQ18045.1 4-carboxymuconolactone decarboxylase [Streptosporangium pseudovulgare]
MPEDNKPTGAQALLGDFAPDLVELTDGALFGRVWPNEALSRRDRSLVTVSALVALYRGNELPFHLRTALGNGLTVEELKQAITHLAFYAGWPNAMTAMTALKQIVENAGTEEG